MMIAVDTVLDGCMTENNTSRTFRLFILAVLTLLLSLLTVACTNDAPAPIAPAINRPTFVWIFSDP